MTNDVRQQCGGAAAMPYLGMELCRFVPSKVFNNLRQNPDDNRHPPGAHGVTRPTSGDVEAGEMLGRCGNRPYRK